MNKVRTITLVGLALSVLALVLVMVDLRAALIVGTIGMALSLRNLATSE